MMRFALSLVISALAVTTTSYCQAVERCQSFYGRIVLYTADGQLRLWHIGTHHEFEPDYDGSDRGASWDKAVDLLTAGNGAAGAAGNNALYADFVVCPTKPLHRGRVQPAIIHSMSHVHVMPRP